MEGIPYVREAMSGSTGTNSMHTQIAGKGVPTALVSPSAPVYAYTGGGDRPRDVEAVARLTAAFLHSFEREGQA